ncbi:MAG: hypothetical protein NZZ41_05900 [Candidatus Dojkabacteria bacterium]|nr:hypothetical protein [Candidatus Dojkabacteria bacterium]
MKVQRKSFLDFSKTIFFLSILFIGLLIYAFINNTNRDTVVILGIGDTNYLENDPNMNELDSNYEFIVFNEFIQNLYDQEIYFDFNFEENVPFDNGIFRIEYDHFNDTYIVYLNNSIPNVENLFSKWLARINPENTRYITILVYDSFSENKGAPATFD